MSIILKEAFRYQHFLDGLLSEAESYLRDYNNYMVITNEHLRSSVVSGASDDVLDNLSDRPLNVSPDVVIGFMLHVCSEKEILSKAINAAKNAHCNEMDMRMSMNKIRKSIIDVLKRMAATKNRETTFKSDAFTFNAEGNQVKYFYDVKQSSKNDFDRKMVKNTIRELSAESDKWSTTIDYWLSSIPVDYTPAFDLNDTFEELVEEYNIANAS